MVIVLNCEPSMSVAIDQFPCNSETGFCAAAGRHNASTSNPQENGIVILILSPFTISYNYYQECRNLIETDNKVNCLGGEKPGKSDKFIRIGFPGDGRDAGNGGKFSLTPSDFSAFVGYNFMEYAH
jgi:hypothetical protein